MAIFHCYVSSPEGSYGAGYGCILTELQIDVPHHMMDLILRTAVVYELFPFIYIQCVVHWLYVGYLGNM